MNKIIALVGMPGAGKSFCVEYLNGLGFPYVYFGGVVVDETIARYGATSPEHEKIVREEFRAKDGMGAIAKRIIPKLNELLETNAVVVADGLYSWTEYKMFKQAYGDDAVIIAIAAPRAVRHARLYDRPIRPLSEPEVSAREYAEIENIEKGGPIANADYTIVNDTTTDDLLADLRDILHTVNIST